MTMPSSLIAATTPGWAAWPGRGLALVSCRRLSPRRVQAPGLADLTPEDVRAQLEPGDAHPTGQIPFTPTAKQALELALRAALSRGDTAIEPRHLLVGITSTSSRGCELVRGVKVEVGWPPPAAPDPAFRVILLDGDAEAWEKQLNDAAELGYELVEIVDKRAILRR